MSLARTTTVLFEPLRAVIAAIVMLCSAVASAAPPPPSEVKAVDAPNDAGESLIVSWKAPEMDLETLARFDVLLRSRDQAFEKVSEAGPTATQVVLEELQPDTPYDIQVVAVDADGASSTPAGIEQPIAPRIQWFNDSRSWLAILLIVVCGAVLAFIAAARRGLNLWVRPIAGLEAVTDAVGRAVEMGKSVMFVPGVLDINEIQTVAGVTVLSRVAKIAAEYDAEIKVPTARSLVMATCRETVQASYLHAGRPESYNADDIYYLTDEQFGFAAGATGQMMREKPAACFYMGAFYAESLILAETGNSIGAIQVAGTAMPSQLPFFIAACDYTLIGEEFFAASAYLSGEPQQLGSLKGQDSGKIVAGVLIILGCVLATVLSVTSHGEAAETATGAISEIFEYLHDNVLGDEGLTSKETP
ncbi:MAG: fibronectin type III domain-containing protein [Planctomycetaceae bacterium]|nr:fibronectin type III domain-containing protein [Planctomycetaceae bacterium]